MNSTINVRVDKKLKDEANQIFEDLGIGMTSAMTMFLKAVVRTRSIPFSLEIESNKSRVNIDKLAVDLDEEKNKQHLSKKEKEKLKKTIYSNKSSLQKEEVK